MTAVRLTGAAHRAELPLLVLGPALGTSAAALWTACAAGLTDAFDVLAWDLPGHGHNRSVPDEPVTMAELATGVLRVVDDVLAQRDEVGGSFAYAGVSAGGAVGLQLLLDAPRRVTSAVLLCSGARIGDVASWKERMGQVASGGTESLVDASAERWFAPGFVDRDPAASAVLLHVLGETHDVGYVAVCGALATFDVRDRLGEIDTPVLAVAGSADVVTPTEALQEVAEGVADGHLVELEGVAHLAPAEAPAEVAALIRQHVLGEVPARPAATGERYAAGLALRRQVLGDAYVDRALHHAPDLTGDFQDLLTEYAWGAVWSRPGLDLRSRSLVTISALVAQGRLDELAVHLRAGRTNGLSVEEIKECLLQTAVYCGVPAARAAFNVAVEVLGDEIA